jgi:hypothetical protein
MEQGGGGGGRDGYGIIPWFHHGHHWYFLTQFGYSSTLHDCKVDPLRGQLEAHETPSKTAVREVKEESGTHCWAGVNCTKDSFGSVCYETT